MMLEKGRRKLAKYVDITASSEGLIDIQVELHDPAQLRGILGPHTSTEGQEIGLDPGQLWRHAHVAQAQAGADDFLYKPILHHDLIDKTHLLLAQSNNGH